MLGRSVSGRLTRSRLVRCASAQAERAVDDLPLARVGGHGPLFMEHGERLVAAARHRRGDQVGVDVNAVEPASHDEALHDTYLFGAQFGPTKIPIFSITESFP